MSNEKENQQYIYYNKYRKAFQDSSSLFLSNTNSDNSSFDAYNWQDPTILGFAIHFSFEEPFSEFDLDNLSNSLLLPESNEYSAINYLKSINEPKRANYLRQFIDLLKSIQTVTPWYFQSVSGVDKLLTIDPKKGWHPGEGAEIEIQMLESIDLRASLLIDLYRKAAWDEHYRRWMLPENMKWFKVKIVISEFRDFHMTERSIAALPTSTESPDYNSSVATGVKNYVNNAKTASERVQALKNPDGSDVDEVGVVYSQTDNTFLPMHILELDMCEFQLLGHAHPYTTSLSAAEAGSTATQSIKFTVGRVNETNYYTLHDIILSEEYIRHGLHHAFIDTSERAALINAQSTQGRKVVHNESNTNFIKDSLKSVEGRKVVHNESNTNFIKDRLKSVAGTLANDAINSLVANLFLGRAFNGEELNEAFKEQKDAYAQVLAQKMGGLYLGNNNITSEGDKANIEKDGHAYPKSKYQGELNVGVKPTGDEQIGNIASTGHATDDSIQRDTNNLISEDPKITKMPKNIGFELPDLNVDIATSIGLTVPDVRTDTTDNIGLDEENPDTEAGGNIELKEP
jgi:hypothetical protein